MRVPFWYSLLSFHNNNPNYRLTALENQLYGEHFSQFFFREVNFVVKAKFKKCYVIFLCCSFISKVFKLFRKVSQNFYSRNSTMENCIPFREISFGFPTESLLECLITIFFRNKWAITQSSSPHPSLRSPLPLKKIIQTLLCCSVGT